MVHRETPPAREESRRPSTKGVHPIDEVLEIGKVAGKRSTPSNVRRIQEQRCPKRCSVLDRLAREARRLSCRNGGRRFDAHLSLRGDLLLERRIRLGGGGYHKYWLPVDLCVVVTKFERRRPSFPSHATITGSTLRFFNSSLRSRSAVGTSPKFSTPAPIARRTSSSASGSASCLLFGHVEIGGLDSVELCEL